MVDYWHDYVAQVARVGVGLSLIGTSLAGRWSSRSRTPPPPFSWAICLCVTENLKGGEKSNNNNNNEGR